MLKKDLLMSKLPLYIIIIICLFSCEYISENKYLDQDLLMHSYSIMYEHDVIEFINVDTFDYLELMNLHSNEKVQYLFYNGRDSVKLTIVRNNNAQYEVDPPINNCYYLGYWPSNRSYDYEEININRAPFLNYYSIPFVSDKYYLQEDLSINYINNIKQLEKEIFFVTNKYIYYIHVHYLNEIMINNENTQYIVNNFKLKSVNDYSLVVFNFIKNAYSGNTDPPIR